MQQAPNDDELCTVGVHRSQSCRRDAGPERSAYAAVGNEPWGSAMRHFAGWIVVRTILVADVVLLVAIGFISLLWVAAPAGALAAAALWLGAGGLLGLLPLTDPYRVEARRLRRRAHADARADAGT
jgi:hypothetical protein